VGKKQKTLNFAVFLVRPKRRTGTSLKKIKQKYVTPVALNLTMGKIHIGSFVVSLVLQKQAI
jgi:hypothetical protein